MATTTFLDRVTPINASWLNDVDDIVYRKAAETISVTDPTYGAIGDGTTDDTAAIQAALNLGKTVYGISGHTYRITSGLTATIEGSILDLNGASILADFTTGWAFSAGDGSTYLQGVGIRNGKIYTANTSTALNGIRYRKNVRRGLAYENLWITDFKGTGMKFEELNWNIAGDLAPLIERCGVNLHIDDNSNAISLHGAQLYSADTYNLIIRGAWSLSISGGVNQGAGTAGIYIDDGLVGSLQSTFQVTITGVYFEDNTVSHIVANNGRGLTFAGNFVNCDTMTGPALQFINWTGADIDGNTPTNLSSGTARDFVEADSSSILISVGKQNVTGVADALVCSIGGSKLGIIESFGNTTATLPTATVTNRGGIVLYSPASGTGANRSRPYMGMDTASGARSYLRLATQPRKMTAATVTSPYTPTLASIDTFDITVPNTGLTIEAPTGSYDDGERITFLLKQNSTGGGNITWNAAYKTAYSNTGNTADKYASVEFVWSAGRSLWIEISAMTWI